MERKLLLPLPRASRGTRRPTVPFKTTSFGAFLCFFRWKQWMKRRHFGQNAPFYLKGNGSKMV
jgi:hypothetical protein